MKTNKKDSKKVEWDDIGQEFKYALYNLGNWLNRALEKNEKEGKGKRRKK
jgi:hypothetical protein